MQFFRLNKNFEIIYSLVLVVFASILFLFLSSSLFSTKVLAVEYPGMACPTGYFVASAGTCCENKSHYVLFQGCLHDSDNTPANGISVGPASTYYCKAGDLRLDFITSTCYEENTLIPGGAGDKSGKYFVGCKKSKDFLPADASPYKVALIPSSPDEYEALDMCVNNGGNFVSSLNNCLCSNGQEKPLSGANTCASLCAGSTVLYDPETSGNKPNICQGPECCFDDAACKACVGDGNSSKIYTAIGCIDTSRQGIVVWLIRIALILTTTIGVFRFVQASFLIRSGDPEKIKEGKEIITSAIIALVLVLISVPLLEFIGVKVLGIFPENFI